MRFVSFGSGSSGNAFLLNDGESSILIDCGIGVRRLRQELKELGVAGHLNAILLSHEHSDHVSALDSLTRYERCPVYASEGTFSSIGKRPGWQTIQDGQSVSIAGVTVTPERVPHDAAEPLGFVLEAGNERIALFTDLGAPAPNVSDAIQDATTVVLESNYCESMLRQSPYPAFLKRRIRSQNGHLSNDDCAATLVEALTPAARRVWLAHLSENNNAPEVAEAAVGEAFAVRGIGLPARSLPRKSSADLLAPIEGTRSWQTALLP